ncbi:MAG: T9SS type A sorting domain-containing protein [Bacteroidota bacterium]
MFKKPMPQSHKAVSVKIILCLLVLCPYLAISQTYPQIGNDITASDPPFGRVLSLNADGTIVAVSDAFGDVVAANNDNTGFVKVYQNQNGTWTQLGSTIFGEVTNDQFGVSVALSADGTIVAAGSTQNNGSSNDTGHVRVFQYNAGTWSQIGSDIDGNEDEVTGHAVSLNGDGTILAIGARASDTSGLTNNGFVRVFHWNGSAWVQLGSDINGANTGEALGYSVHLSEDGTRLAVGGSEEYTNTGASNNGVVRIYEWNGSVWSQLGSDLTGASNERLGHSISMNAEGSRIAMGAPLNAGGGTFQGSAYIYEYNGSSWNLLGSKIDGDAFAQTFGVTLDLSADGNLLAVGMPSINPIRNDSRVRLFEWNGSSWTKFSQDAFVETATEQSGNDVSLSADGSIMAIGFLGISTVRVAATRASKVWLGATSTDWSTASNWSDGSIPIPLDDVLITKVSNQPTASSALTLNSVTLNPGTSLIAQAGLTGTLTYNRYLDTDNWYLVAVPASGETLEDMINNNTFATGSSSNIGWAPYINATSSWDFQTSASTGSLTTGQGYSVKLTSPSILTFSGSFISSDVTNINLTDNSGVGGDAFNLVGNPYPSFISGNSNADASNNILGVNSAALAQQTIWLWNQATTSYDTFNLASNALHIAPGQGFFVQSISGGSSSFSITEAMQSHQSTDTFQRNSSNVNPEIELILSDQNRQKQTHIYYINGTTTGFDNGYDSTTFSGGADDFSIYSHLVTDSQDLDMAIQSLPQNNYENMVVPVGVNAASGTQIYMSAATTNLPENIEVYLEDAAHNTFTLLDQTSVYSTTLTGNSSGIGRFYLHTSPQALSLDDPVLNAINIYAVDNQLRIVGLDGENAHLRIYNMLGQTVLDTQFKGTGSNAIALPRVSTGLYLVELLAETGRVHKKLILK